MTKDEIRKQLQQAMERDRKESEDLRRKREEFRQSFRRGVKK